MAPEAVAGRQAGGVPGQTVRRVVHEHGLAQATEHRSGGDRVGVHQRHHRVVEPGDARDAQHRLHVFGDGVMPQMPSMSAAVRPQALITSVHACAAREAWLRPEFWTRSRGGGAGEGDRVLHRVVAGDRAHDVAPSTSRNTGSGVPARSIQSSETRLPIESCRVRRTDHGAGEPQAGLVVEFDRGHRVRRAVVDTGRGWPLVQEHHEVDGAGDRHPGGNDRGRPALRTDRERWFVATCRSRCSG